MKKIVLTGDRPTGCLHIGHYVGSLRTRKLIQDEGNYDEFYIEIADAQALTDNYDNPDKVKNNILNVVLDYLSVGIDPNKVTIFLQSQVKGLYELTFYYMNLVTLSRLLRNPTVKNEIKLRGFDNSIPSGFLNYPVSQAADITGFDATIIPVGDDQEPMIEQTREIVRSFNNIYGDTLYEPKAILPDSAICKRLPGLDGGEKMGKSLGNAIYLSDTKEEIEKKVMSAYTDPNHIKVEDPGKTEGNMVFTYLEVFATDESFKKYYPEFNNLDELKKAYQKGGIGDVKIKRFLINVLEDTLEPIREKRKYYEDNIDLVKDIIKKGTKKANEDCDKVVKRVEEAMKINYNF